MCLLINTIVYPGKMNVQNERPIWLQRNKVCGAASVDVAALFIGMVTTHLRNDYMHYSLINYTGACLWAEGAVCTVGEEGLDCWCLN